MSRLSARCPKCQGAVSYEPHHAGSAANCPICREVIQLPHGSQPSRSSDFLLPFLEPISYLCFVGWFMSCVAASVFAMNTRDGAEALGRSPDPMSLEMAGSFGWLGVLLFIAGLAFRIEIAIREKH